MTSQPDGSYPRLNGKLMESGRCANMIVSVVLCEPDAQVQLGSIYELVGHANSDGTLQLFVTRELSVDMDLEIYNRMIVEVQHNPKFVDYFPSIPA
ncbi:Replication factor A protein 3 [Fragilaria crotonensis]|nr:Replication factor A protein 3 [Fragilaria crotonensis]